MAAGDTAPPLAASSSPPPLLDNSPSNLSSPLSDVEDKDADHEDMELDNQDDSSGRPGTPKRNGNSAGDDSEPDEESDDESKLSEMDVNDSEAETERLYDTPPKNGVTRDMLDILGEVGNRQFVDRRTRVFERSPSKLQQLLQADLATKETASDNESLSDADEEEDDASIVSSDPEPAPTKSPRLRSPTQVKKSQETTSITDSAASQITRPDSQESRKRKRSSVAEQSELEQPLRKRTGSIGAPEGDFSADDAAVADDEVASTNPQSGTHTGEEDNNDDAEATGENKEDPADSAEETIGPGRAKKTKRNSPKKRTSKSPEELQDQVAEEAPDDPPDGVEGTPADDPVPHAEDEHVEDADEEAEAAHRNEEECKNISPLSPIFDLYSNPLP